MVKKTNKQNKDANGNDRHDKTNGDSLRVVNDANVMCFTGFAANAEGDESAKRFGDLHALAVNPNLPAVVIGNGGHNELVCARSSVGALKRVLGVFFNYKLVFGKTRHHVLKSLHINIPEAGSTALDIVIGALQGQLEGELGILFLHSKRNVHLLFRLHPVLQCGN